MAFLDDSGRVCIVLCIYICLVFISTCDINIWEYIQINSRHSSVYIFLPVRCADNYSYEYLHLVFHAHLWMYHFRNDIGSSAHSDASAQSDDMMQRWINMMTTMFLSHQVTHECVWCNVEKCNSYIYRASIIAFINVCFYSASLSACSMHLIVISILSPFSFVLFRLRLESFKMKVLLFLFIQTIVLTVAIFRSKK